MANSGRFKPGQNWRPFKIFRDKQFLIREYLENKRSASEIAKQFGVGDTAIHFWLKKHGIPTRTVSEARKIKKWGSHGIDNPMWNRKGELNPNWKGGVSPLRQVFYESREWKKAARAVWKRDRGTCQRCGLVHSWNSDMPFHIHHIRSFADESLRAEVANLILLCEVCHHWVHSLANANREFLEEGGVN